MGLRGSLGLAIACLVTLGFGCDFRREKAGISEPLTSDRWYQRVRAQVLVPRCVSCHGSSGGVNLETYEGVRKNLTAIERTAIAARTMPQGRALTDAEYATLAEWVKAGAPLDAPNGVSPSPTPSPSPEAPLTPTFSSIHKRIIEVHCISCHSDKVGAEAHNFPMETYDELLNPVHEIVLPGNPDESGIIISVTIAKKPMPPLKTGDKLTAEEIAVIRQWIADGALQ